MAVQGTHWCSASLSKLPSGFRFDPTWEELIVHFVKPKNEGSQLPFDIPTINPFKHHPKTLPAHFQFGIKKESYYFTQLEPMNERESRVKRSMEGGFWKTTSNDKEIRDSTTKKTIGFEKTFAFYEGSPKEKIKTNWIMHEFRCEPSVNNASSSTKFKKKFAGYVLCVIYQKTSSASSISVEASADIGKECLPMASTEEVEPGPIPQYFTPQHSSGSADSKTEWESWCNELYDNNIDVVFQELPMSPTPLSSGSLLYEDSSNIPDTSIGLDEFGGLIWRT